MAAGGRCVLDGGVVDGPGTFYAPVIAADIPTDSPLAVEESFGPAAAVFAVGDADEAVALANASSFGLSANLWTSDRARAQQLAPRIEAGGVFINATTASDPRVPFGGIKRSGYGRELGREGIRYAMEDMTEIRLLVIRTPPGAQARTAETPARRAHRSGRPDPAAG